MHELLTPAAFDRQRERSESISIRSLSLAFLDPLPQVIHFHRTNPALVCRSKLTLLLPLEVKVVVFNMSLSLIRAVLGLPFRYVNPIMLRENAFNYFTVLDSTQSESV